MLTNFFKDKTVLITGGTGSFGKSFTARLLRDFSAKKIIVFSRDEYKQHQMDKELKDDRLRFFVGDVRDLPRLQRAFSGVDVVIHAAALKQVPTLEYNPYEAVKTNVLGSQNVIEAAIDQKVYKVLLISTDKAAYPSNLYGSTKLCAEKLFVSANSYTGGKTKFGAVRYGNVLLSRGAFVETLLNHGKTDSVKITDLEMTRFWINLRQAHELVSFALGQMEGGEIFIPKIPSMKIIDLVKTILPQASRKVIGMRPGEKMHEILLTQEESAHAIELKKHFVILPEFPFWSDSGYQKYFKEGKKPTKGYCYCSQTNSEWLRPAALKKALKRELEGLN